MSRLLRVFSLGGLLVATAFTFLSATPHCLAQPGVRGRFIQGGYYGGDSRSYYNTRGYGYRPYGYGPYGPGWNNTRPLGPSVVINGYGFGLPGISLRRPIYRPYFSRGYVTPDVYGGTYTPYGYGYDSPYEY